MAPNRILFPDAQGTYVLLLQPTQPGRLQVGRLGQFELLPGFYAYVGSAFGPGGLRARLGHHLGLHPRPHWHIDYLLLRARVVEIWHASSEQKLEAAFTLAFAGSGLFETPLPRFGASDFRGPATTHLFFSRRRPAFSWFEKATASLFQQPAALQRQRF